MITTISETMPIKTDSSGVMRIGKTRVTLETVLEAFKDGETAEEIALAYPSLSLADIYSVIGYYLNHKIELENYLHRQKEQSLKIRLENESRFNQIGIRERLLARKSKC